ncbi:hypothetical protein LEP1GSC121_0857 [Leptospira borgpetersenii serovar Castellonis str. 200801910]|nr:hypothetical protein LEP1GSC121_0857 [Leptospira borgpetersenii serovar Castellonis str. 200801910]
MNRRSGELTHHLDCERNSSSGNNSGNSRNGKSGKKFKGYFETIGLEVSPELLCER